ncbi:MAG: nicotinate-nucleotide adenylyltransferase [Clostridiales bacterium]|nr:nicotinate-nucleotide adenylyltransferase [Clostridiales bacterium]
MTKVGIMGGTFNPIHFGHLILAETAYEEIGLDRILFMPSKNPPHKDSTEVISEEHRLKMVELAVQGNPHFQLSTIELDREGTTYTVDTLAQLTKENPNTDYYFILGADSLIKLETWKNCQGVLDLCTVVVAGRDDLKTEDIQLKIQYYKDKYGARIITLNMQSYELSSGFLRDRISKGKSIQYYVPEKVKDYILSNFLYMSNSN